MLDKETLSAVRKVIGDMRFMQASSIVASGLNEHKQAIAYMNHLAKLDKALEQEILKGGAA
jgi:hypothetical protein